MGEFNESTQTELEKLAIAWINLSFSGKSLLSREPKTILKQVNGCVYFGTLNALMGPSGAGKSTLLKCINGRNNSGMGETTKIYLSSSEEIRSCFIVQDVKEHLLMGLTALESLIYASKLKNSGVARPLDHKNNALKLMKDLMISDTAKTLISNCSGGEQKRLAIAAELTSLRKPNLLCVDEPTSGLDSNAAEVVVQCLKDISRKHQIATVASIHQPNADVLLMFDQLYVLAKGGACVFSAPPQELGQYLNDAGIEYEDFQIPIEVLLKVSSRGLEDSKVKALIENNSKHKSKLIEVCTKEAVLAPDGIQFPNQTFTFKHFAHLLNRMMVSSYRSQWIAMLMQFVFIIGLGVILVSLYNEDIGVPAGCISLQFDANASCVKSADTLREESLLRQNLKFSFFANVLLFFLQVVATTLTFTEEVKIFLNEHSNGWYSTSSYYWAKTVVELPLTLLIGSAYAAMAYKVSGQIDEDFRFYGFMYIVIVGVLCSQGVGFLFGIISEKNEQLAVVLSVGTFLIHMFFCGFFIPLAEMLEPLQWISHGSYMRQAFQNILMLVYGFDRCPDGFVPAVLYQLELNEDNDLKLTVNFVAITIHLIIFRLLSLFALIVKANPSQSLKSSMKRNQVKPMNIYD